MPRSGNADPPAMPAMLKSPHSNGLAIVKLCEGQSAELNAARRTYSYLTKTKTGETSSVFEP
jgi:hypothetical protein